MRIFVSPVLRLDGNVCLPPSKSYSIRSFIIAACGGHSTIIAPSDCDDARVACAIAQKLGVTVTKKNDQWHVVASGAMARRTVFNVKESGTVLRFLLPLVCRDDKPARITGQGTLIGRPNKFLLDALRRMGADIHGTEENESVPIVKKSGILDGGKVVIDGSLSSQFISALLITCPLLARDTRMVLKGEKVVSEDYITMTRQVLALAGIKVLQRGSRAFLIPGGQKYKGLKNFHVPSDYGLAAFLMAAAVLNPSDVVLQGYFNDRFLQADGRIVDFLKKMGVPLKVTRHDIHIKGPCVLKGGTFSLKDCPDLVPIMAILALFAKTPTQLVDIGHARVKESDRISDLRCELLKIGADVRETKNELIINPHNNYKNNCKFNPHHDHRLAMSLAVLGLKIGAMIDDIECTRKSYPEFVRDFKSLGAKVLQR